MDPAKLSVMRAALVVSVAYAAIWEAGQLLFALAEPLDCLVDWLAVTLGAFAAASAWARVGHRMALSLAILGALLFAGIRQRR